MQSTFELEFRSDNSEEQPLQLSKFTLLILHYHLFRLFYRRAFLIMGLSSILPSRLSPRGWAGLLIVLAAISVSMHKKSSQYISSTAQILLQQDVFNFSPSRMDFGFSSSLYQAASVSDKPIDVGKPLNVVVMYADDWRHDAIGVAGTLPVETPFIDWLSRNMGMRFTHNCAPTSICWASRAIYMTGTYHARNKAIEPGSEGWYEFFPKSFPALLKEAGYYVAHIGKRFIHFHFVQNYSNVGFQFCEGITQNFQYNSGKWHTWNSVKIQHYYHHFKEVRHLLFIYLAMFALQFIALFSVNV